MLSVLIIRGENMISRADALETTIRNLRWWGLLDDCERAWVLFYLESIVDDLRRIYGENSVP